MSIGLPGPHTFPPAGLAGQWMRAGDILVAGQRMAQQDRVRPVFGQRPVGLIGDLDTRQCALAIERQRSGKDQRSRVCIQIDLAAKQSNPVFIRSPAACRRAGFLSCDEAEMAQNDTRPAAPTMKPWIAGIHAYVPGKSTGADGRKLIKLSANENPLGCSAQVLAALACDHAPAAYPDPDAAALRAALGREHRIDPRGLSAEPVRTNC